MLSGLRIAAILITITITINITVNGNEEQQNEMLSHLLDNETFPIANSDFPLLCVLKNLSTNESARLEQYLQKKTYANLKKMIDTKVQEFPESTRQEIEEFKYSNLAASPDKLLTNWTLGKTEVDLIEAYQNATMYNFIRAVWNAQISQILPQIDQLVILEYFHEKRIDDLKQMGMLARLWAAIKGWFSPECIRQFIYSLSPDERNQFDKIVESDNLTKVSQFIQNKINEIPIQIRDEFEQWTHETYVPRALFDIVNNVTETERQSLERLRTHKLVTALKDYYRDMIEEKSSMEQNEIHNFFLKMNQTFARCYNPMPYKEKLWRKDENSDIDYF